METEISLIFGLTLLEHLDIYIIIGAISTPFLAGVIFFVNWWQISQKIKVNSANLILEFLKPWSNDSGFVEILRGIRDPEFVHTHHDKLSMVLDYFEDMAVLQKDGTLKLSHVQEYFGPNLRTLCAEHIQDFIRHEQQQNPRLYVNLQKMLKKIK